MCHDRRERLTKTANGSRMTPTRYALLGLLLASAIGCNVPVHEETVPGPETDTLVPAVRGYVLTTPSCREIVALELPSLKETTIRPTRPKDPNDDPIIHRLSGPDSKGRIAYIEDHYFVRNEKERRHLLKTIRLDGSEDTELFTRPGDAMWATTAAGHGEIGEHLALSPVGGRVAFMSGLSDAQTPGALLLTGSVEIWDVETKTRVKTEIKGSDEGLAWLPDGKHLAYVKLVEPKIAWALQDKTDTFGSTFRKWDKVPAVFVRDVDAGTEALVHVGWDPVVSSDGKSVFLSDNEGAWRRIDLATGKSSIPTLRGAPLNDYIIASLASDIVLTRALPTQGLKVKQTESNSPLVGPKEMLSLKLAKLNSDDFQTIVPYIDPRTRLSFGSGNAH